MTTFGFLPVSVITLVIYLTSYFFTKTNRFKFPTHRRIWNLILMVSFFVAGIIGVGMSFIKSFDLDVEIPNFILKIHVGVGLVWFIIALFHFFWHLTYFKKALKFFFTKN